MDLTERERLISHSQKQWTAIFDAITDLIFVTDEEYKLVKVNFPFATILGMHPRDLIGKNCREILGLNILAKKDLMDVVKNGRSYTFEKVIDNASYQISIFPLYFEEKPLAIHIMKNISEIQRSRNQMYHSSKLFSLGVLAAGVAHELNNPLTGVIAYTEMLLRKNCDKSFDEDLKKIMESAQRCEKIVKNLLSFSRQRMPLKTLESINDIIDKAVELRNYKLSSNNIEIVRKYENIQGLLVDSQQIQQAILNILLNAEYAIIEAKRTNGRIIFATNYNEDRTKAIIKITDNGTGIPEGLVHKIFDPFFTTKPVGSGTGLGLSIAYGIITEHGGTVKVESTEGEGSMFTVELPASLESSDAFHGQDKI